MKKKDKKEYYLIFIILCIFSLMLIAYLLGYFMLERSGKLDVNVKIEEKNNYNIIKGS